MASTEATPRHRKPGPVVAASLLLMAFAYGLVEASNFPSAAAGLPMATSALGVILSIGILVMEVKRYVQLPRPDRRSPADAKKRDSTLGALLRERDSNTGYGAGLALLIFALVVVCWLALGFPYGAAVFVFIFAKFIDRRSWSISIAFTVGLIVVLHVGFVELAHIRPFSGLLLS